MGKLFCCHDFKTSGKSVNHFFFLFSSRHVLFLSSKSYMKSNGSRAVGLIRTTGNQVNINVNWNKCFSSWFFHLGKATWSLTPQQADGTAFNWKRFPSFKLQLAQGISLSVLMNLKWFVKFSLYA